MFLQDFENLVRDHPKLSKAATSVDTLLSNFGTNQLIVPKLVGEFSGESEGDILPVLRYLEQQGATIEVPAHRCSRCGTYTTVADSDEMIEAGDQARCTACNKPLDTRTVLHVFRLTGRGMSDNIDPKAKAEHVIVLIHGIRTHANWQELVASYFEADKPRTQVVPIKYGFFDTLKFLSPILTRRGPRDRVERELRDIINENPNAKISVLAHSFGTYTIAEIIRDKPDLKFERLLLCGCIIPADFRWDAVKASSSCQILNDCGTKDIWPVLAQTITWGYGSSGLSGFGSYRVRDRFHNFTHSEFFDAKFIEEFWLPYLKTGVVKPSSHDVSRPSPPLYLSLLATFHLKYIGIVVIIIIMLWSMVSLIK